MANGYVPKGYFTYRAEGTEKATEKFHWPGGASGVTIGKGYDMKDRSESDIYIDMISVGVSQNDANIIKKASHKTGLDAKKFADENKDKIKPLTKTQKIDLFNKIWHGTYIPRARSVYNGIPETIHEKDIKNLNKSDSKESWKKTKWEDLDDKIMEIIVDLIYQGAYFKDIKYASTKNDKDYLVKCMETYPKILKWDEGRRRIPYLKGTFDVVNF